MISLFGKKTTDNYDRKAWIVIIRLARLYMYGKGNPDIERLRAIWRGELASNLYTIGTDRLSKKDLLKAFHVKDVSSVLADISVADANLRANPKRLENTKNFEQIVKSYFVWIAGELSSCDSVNIQSIYGKLDELGLTVSPSF